MHTDLSEGTVSTAVTTLLKFLLESISESGRGYLVVYKALYEFCQGQCFLSEQDRSYLFDQLKRKNLDTEITQLEGDCLVFCLLMPIVICTVYSVCIKLSTIVYYLIWCIEIKYFILFQIHSS